MDELRQERSSLEESHHAWRAEEREHLESVRTECEWTRDRLADASRRLDESRRELDETREQFHQEVLFWRSQASSGAPLGPVAAPASDTSKAQAARGSEAGISDIEPQDLPETPGPAQEPAHEEAWHEKVPNDQEWESPLLGEHKDPPVHQADVIDQDPLADVSVFNLEEGYDEEYGPEPDRESPDRAGRVPDSTPMGGSEDSFSPGTIGDDDSSLEQYLAQFTKRFGIADWTLAEEKNGSESANESASVEDSGENSAPEAVDQEPPSLAPEPAEAKESEKANIAPPGRGALYRDGGEKGHSEKTSEDRDRMRDLAKMSSERVLLVHEVRSLKNQAKNQLAFAAAAFMIGATLMAARWLLNGSDTIVWVASAFFVGASTFLLSHLWSTKKLAERRKSLAAIVGGGSDDALDQLAEEIVARQA